MASEREALQEFR